MNSSTSYKPSADEVKRLREATGAGMIECRNALVAAAGDFEKAQDHLVERGQAALAKKSDRTANEGLIGSYIHAGGKIGVLVELNCETDFVARNERFTETVRDLAIHIAALSPTYVDRESVPPEVLEKAKAEFAAEGNAAASEGRLDKWFEEHVLLDQSFVKDDSKTVGELIGALAGVLGENIRIGRFIKFALGEV